MRISVTGDTPDSSRRIEQERNYGEEGSEIQQIEIPGGCPDLI
jgi:hypothetical protein